MNGRQGGKQGKGEEGREGEVRKKTEKEITQAG